MSVVKNVFPEDFSWGALLDAHQTEGNDFNSDWWRWEQRPGRISNNETSEFAVNHYNLFKEDLALAAQLSLNSLFYTPSWARIQPRPDQFDEEVLAHYRQVFNCMQKQGITPTVVLFHAAAPRWFTRQGGWAQPMATQYFERYAHRLAECIGPYCTRFIPLLEPEHWLTMSCREKIWPGGVGCRQMNTLRLQLARAHLAASGVIRKLQPNALVGISLRGMECIPEYPHSTWDQRIACRETQRYIEAFPNALSELSNSTALFDFILLHHCGRQRVRSAPWSFLHGGMRAVDHQGKRQRYDLPLFPQEGFWSSLEAVRSWEIPIYLMGSNTPNASSEAQCGMLCDHAFNLLEGLQRGYPLKGYASAALMDGFEWTDGYSLQRGLVHVDRNSMNRTPTSLAFLMKDLSKHRQLRPHMLLQCCPDWKPPREDTL